ncbi:hypothetical protein [Burkholderia pseudomallei]|uniref:hypothetical protein n=2 Tax=Burkholderia pseudomallei TaxID=28450 RepID=UPI000A46EE38|nr:hypothetical protein [Burkholderia pseudomallei]
MGLVMTLSALTGQLRDEMLPLDQLYLDPNNPRFVDSNWQLVPESTFSDAEVQDRTMRRMNANFGIDKLRLNMEVNGYLPIDRVIVREFQDNKYVVLEGNRRICAAKMMGDFAIDGSAISDEVKESLKQIPVLVYTGADQNAAWIFQGLRHIAGVEDWSAFNKAKLLVEQMEEEGLGLTEVGRRFGLTAHGAGQWVRGYYAFKQAQESSDYVAEVTEQAYPYFQELFSRSNTAVREWLGWSEAERTFTETINFNEFVSWLYPKPDDGDGGSGRGNFDRRWLARRDDIRDVAMLIREAPELFAQFRSDGRLEHAKSQIILRELEREAKEKADPVKDVFDVIRACTRALDNLPLRIIKDAALNSELTSLLSDLEEKMKFVRD